jgi:5'-phosphate synthase pdxT subunit
LRPASIGLPPIGVLAVQGDVAEHVRALERSGAHVRTVKTVADLDAVGALVVPGGESTTVIRLLDRFALADPIVARVRAGMPFWGTCMGMIVAARDVAGEEAPGLRQRTLDLIDITVRRNAFGRQRESSEVALEASVLGPAPFPAIFIRAPWVERAGSGVSVLASAGSHPVFVREGSVMATSFHPELTADDRVHAYFLSMVAGARERGAAA